MDHQIHWNDFCKHSQSRSTSSLVTTSLQCTAPAVWRYKTEPVETGCQNDVDFSTENKWTTTTAIMTTNLELDKFSQSINMDDITQLRPVSDLTRTKTCCNTHFIQCHLLTYLHLQLPKLYLFPTPTISSDGHYNYFKSGLIEVVNCCFKLTTFQTR